MANYNQRTSIRLSQLPDCYILLYLIHFNYFPGSPGRLTSQVITHANYRAPHGVTTHNLFSIAFLSVITPGACYRYSEVPITTGYVTEGVRVQLQRTKAKATSLCNKYSNQFRFEMGMKTISKEKSFSRSLGNNTALESIQTKRTRKRKFYIVKSLKSTNA